MTDRLATAQVQHGYAPSIPQNAVVPPIYQTAAYEFADPDEAADVFALRRAGNLYSRTSTPTQVVLEKRLARLEGGTAAVAVASGQAAVAVALLALARTGEHIVAARQLYGGTVDLLQETFADWGIDVTFVDHADADAWRAAVRPQTRAFFAESVTNPTAEVLDICTVADIAHAAGVPFVVDSTVATPALQRPGEYGADIVVHSATKYLGGHGTSMAGVVVDVGSFDFGAEPARWPQLTRPLPRAHGIVLWDRFGPSGTAFTTLLRAKYVHDLGPSPSPFNAFQILQGIETLDVRVARHAASALAVAQALRAHPAVAAVHHPGLPDSPWHEVAARYLPDGIPALFSFDLVAPADRAGAREVVSRFVDALHLVRLVANIGDTRSLVVHPASMTHSHLTDAQLREAGMSPATVRLSVGLEDPADIIDDLRRGLDAAASVTTSIVANSSVTTSTVANSTATTQEDAA